MNKKAILISAAILSLSVGTVPAQAGLFGPGKFKVEQTDDRFSDAPTTIFTGRNNRVSKKSVVGGVHVDDKGMYLEPLVVKSRADGSVVRTGFVLHNKTQLSSDYGSPNSIGIPQRASFLIDGTKLIKASIYRGESSSGDRIDYNSVGRYASIAIAESGTIFVTPDQMQAIANARTVAIKIEGSRRSVVYEPKDIGKKFLKNVRSFWTAYGV